MNLIFLLFTLLTTTNCMVLDYSNRISLDSLKHIKNTLNKELKSLVSPIPQTSSDTDIFILPSDLLTSEIYDKLGLGFLNIDSFSVDLNIDKLQVPKDFKNLFIFNTSNQLNIPEENVQVLAQFIDQSLPFDVPSFMNLKNYGLVLPRSYLETKLNSTKNLINPSSIFSRGIIQGSTTNFPIFRSAISENKPLMIFVFSDSDIDQFQNFKTPIMNVKNYLKTEKNMVSNFFDTFAKTWIKSAKYDSLIKSVFCTTNSINTDDSYCLQIHDKGRLDLFPAFLDISQLLSRGRYTNETKVESQAIRQVHDKLSKLADKFNDVSYELATEPKPVIERVDERVDEKVYRFYDKVDSKKDSIQNKVDTSKSFVEGTVEGIKDFVQEKAGVTKGFIEGKFGDIEDTISSVVDDAKVKLDLQKRQESDLEKRFEANIYSEKLVLPLSLVRLAEYPVVSPRNKQYSQVPVLDTPLKKRFSIFSNDYKDCEKITWYNVFHHSIFGKPQFCLDE